MKTGFFNLAAASLLGLVAARPHHVHRLAERAVVTTVEFVTVTTPAVIVHIQGTKTWTVTHYVQPTGVEASDTTVSSTATVPVTPATELPIIQSDAAPTTVQSTPEVIPAASSSDNSASVVASENTDTRTSAVDTTSYVDPVTTAEYTPEATSQAAAPTETQPAPVEQPSTPAEASSMQETTATDMPTVPVETPTPVSKSGGNGYGVSYNPYAADGSCKNVTQVSNDIDVLADYSLVRIYGTDCDQLDTVIPAVQQHPGMKLFLGMDDISSSTNEANMVIDAVKKYFNGDWSVIDTVGVGNEAVTNGKATISGVVDAVNNVRSILRSAGYNGPVVTVETVATLIDTPDDSGLALCQASDYTAANCHAFFDTSGYYTSGSKAGDFVSMQYDRLVKSCGSDRRTVISESGWPHGSTLPKSSFVGNVAIPDDSNHKDAIASLLRAFEDHAEDLVVFSAFDDKWKKDTADTKGAEGFWGINY